MVCGVANIIVHEGCGGGELKGASGQVATYHALRLSLPMSLPDRLPDCPADSPRLVLPVNQMPSQVGADIHGGYVHKYSRAVILL